MNNCRRKILLEAAELVSRAHSLVEDCAMEEQEYYENMPEGIQTGEKGERAEEVAGDLETLHEELDDIRGRIEGCS